MAQAAKPAQSRAITRDIPFAVEGKTKSGPA